MAGDLQKNNWCYQIIRDYTMIPDHNIVYQK